MLTTFLPPNTAASLSSALMLRLFFWSWSLFLRMYAQTLLVTSVRGRGFSPTTAPSWGDGVSGFMNAAFGLRFAAFLGAAFFADFFAGAFFAAFFLVAMLSSLHY